MAIAFNAHIALNTIAVKLNLNWMACATLTESQHTSPLCLEVSDGAADAVVADDAAETGVVDNAAEAGNLLMLVFLMMLMLLLMTMR